MKKTSKFEDGDVFEIFLSKKLFAYCRVIGRNDWSPLFELFRETFRTPQDIEALKNAQLSRRKVAYINKYSLKDKKTTRFVGNLSLSPEARRHPPIFKGDPYSFWIVFSEGKTERFSPDEVSYEDLLEKDYVGYTIFPIEDVVDLYLKNKPLVFPPHLKSFNKK